MPGRQLGRQGLSVSALGLGCMGMSDAYGAADESESIATLHHALELGVTLIDTAEQYGPFTNEDLLSRALQGHRQQVVRNSPTSTVIAPRSRPQQHLS